MKLIAITQPSMIEDEARHIHELLETGFDIVHLRKPDADVEQCRRLLRELSDEDRRKIIIHDYHELINEFDLKGLHFNKNVTIVPQDYEGFKTKKLPFIANVIIVSILFTLLHFTNFSNGFDIYSFCTIFAIRLIILFGYKVFPFIPFFCAFHFLWNFGSYLTLY